MEDRSTYGTYMKLTNMHEINELKEKLSNQILEITVISNDRIEDNLLIKNVDIIIYPREFEKKVKECKGICKNMIKKKKF